MDKAVHAAQLRRPHFDAQIGVADIPAVESIDRYQRDATADPDWLGTDEIFLEGLMHWVAENHRFNGLLWEQEDLARRRNVADAEIVANKRAIDRYNQCRNDAIEAIDDAISDAMKDVAPQPDAYINSETAGSIIDRLSINSLKIRAMHQQTQRGDASAAHRSICAGKLERLFEQRRDLLSCLNTLLQGMRSGRCTYKIYRQFKMYNDPAMNPHLADSLPQPVLSRGERDAAAAVPLR